VSAKPNTGVIAIALGDAGGIGPEVALKAVAAELAADDVRYLIIGDEALVHSLNAQVGKLRLASEAAARPGDRILVRSLPSQPRPKFLPAGSAEHAQDAIAWLKEGAALCLRGEAGALVTAPVNKESIIRSGEKDFVGQTELLSALATEAIGVHAIFGAFLFGAAVPHDGRVAKELTERISGLVTTLLLPAFFALVGMRTEIGLVSGWQNWLVCLVIIAVATLGKFGGTLAAARVVGKGWREAASLGILMNTRGLMELIVLNIGLDLGVISPTLFAMMVLMALVTTVATSPILYALMPHLAAPLSRAAEEPVYMNR